jgi:hypothetical protein
MMPDMLAPDAPITPEWLTSALREGGALPQGEVAAVHLRANDAFNSAAAHLEVRYSSDAPETAPRRLFLKRAIAAEWALRAGAREVAFYQFVAPHRARLPMLVPCYAAAVDAASGQSFCLLLDVSETHAPPVTREQLIAGAVPAEALLDQVVDALAAFHAFWWEHPLLGQSTFELPSWYADEARHAQFVEETRRNWARFLEAEGAWFPEALRLLYEQVLAGYPVLWERYIRQRVATHRRMTLSHGDCYLSQFLCPAPGTSSQTYLIDFQGPAADFGAMDLVFLFATFWPPAQRREGQREERLLRRYHQALAAQGVRGYSWETLLTDYRLALTYMLSYPVWDRNNGSRKDYWWPKLQCLAGAFQDWQCFKLLAG